MEKVTTQAVLIDYDCPAELAPLTSKRAVSTLTVGGKPIIQHWCEHLADAGVRELILILSTNPENVRDFVQDGSRWGFTKVLYQYHPALKNWFDVEAIIKSRADDSTFIINLHSLPILALEKIPYSTYFWKGRPVAHQYSEGIRPITSIDSLWQANMDYLQGDVPCLKGAEPVNESGLTASPESHIAEGVDLQLVNIIGPRTVVREQVKLNNSVIGSGCYLEPSAHIKMSVVLDDTYVGSHIDIRYAVVDGPLIHRIDIGATTWIDDPHILSRLDKDFVSRTPMAERVFALILAIISLPYMLFRKTSIQSVLIPQRLDHSGQVYCKKLRLRTIHSNHPLLRKLPWLWSVFLGKLRLVGINKEVTKLPQWASHQADHPPGPINLADLNSLEYEQKDKESILIANNFQLVNQSGMDKFKLCMRWLKALLNTDIRRTDYELKC